MVVRHSEYPPIPGDFFATPRWVTEALLSVERFTPPVLVPARGRGGVSDVIAEHYETVAWDIAQGYDFFEDTQPYPTICTNPPWSNGMGDRFVRHALELTRTPRGKVAMLLPTAWTASKRYEFFRDCPAFKTKHELTRRISWDNLEKRGQPAMNHCWCVWDYANQAPPTIGWLP